MKNPIIFFLCSIFITLNIADMITAHFILPGEANPLFIIFQSIIVLDILKVALTVLLLYVVWNNNYVTEFNYFVIISTMLLGSLILLFGVGSNIYGIMNPAEVAASADIPNDVKVKAYFSVVGIMYVLPMLFSLLSFWIFQKTKHKAEFKPQ